MNSVLSNHIALQLPNIVPHVPRTVNEDGNYWSTTSHYSIKVVY